MTLVVYDIGNDSRRREAERTCMDHGLTRVQHSVFRGCIDEGQRTSLVRQFEGQAREDEEETWDVQVYFISRDDFRAHVRLGPKGRMEDLAGTPEILLF